MQKLCVGFKNINFRTRFCGRKIYSNPNLTVAAKCRKRQRKFNFAPIATCKKRNGGLKFIVKFIAQDIAECIMTESNLICDRFVFVCARKIRLNLRG
ncbi:MAG: hypothetical protein ACTTJF_06870 [Campylobacter sp.]|uniref:hypothetical protein n=1 Tax=Campylobacter sp. TaxID=205 RepID=UPI003F9EFBD9